MRKNRAALSLLLLASLCLAGVARYWAYRERCRLVPPTPADARLENLNSFSLALVLGGLRGPLVMYLWTSSESQKNEKQLEDIDTKIELIRLLQSEFDSVNIFQIWNKAYNLSVQMASLSNKYATILHAMEYARKVEAGRPNNLNMVSAIAGLYFDKLGNSAEKRYYNERLRQETLPPEAIARITLPQRRLPDLMSAARSVGIDETQIEINLDGPRKLIIASMRKSAADRVAPQLKGEGISTELIPAPPRRSDVRRTYHVQMLDADGHLLPAYADLPPERRPADWTDQLQYLWPYDKDGGFPYGLSPMALAYNYHKRSQVLQITTRQKHLQLSESVISSRPAIALKAWAEEEWERGRRAELLAMGEKPASEKLALELPGAPLTDADIQQPMLLRDARFAYERAAKLASDAGEEYDRHIARGNLTMIYSRYDSHRDALAAMRALMQADLAYVELLMASADKRADLAASARKHYQEAIDGYYVMILKYYTENDVAAATYPLASYRGADGRAIGYNKETIASTDPARPGIDKSLYPYVHARAMLYMVLPPWSGGRSAGDLHREDRTEYETYIARATQRLTAIARITSGQPRPSRTILGPS